MSGRPRTTSFAESCKPVPQPSAFGNMKVSRTEDQRDVCDSPLTLSLFQMSPQPLYSSVTVNFTIGEDTWTDTLSST
ncbi:hypothetical protein R3I93_005829 [Phoxinus phoxinus]|uniref:Uncharacterized protein n=1 Tax=Phoxinus phoxinus TaxID=58324 RepID=A0AAN9DC98_9TELE